LLDTHTLIWAAQNSPRLSSAAREVVQGSDPLLVSVVTAWEYADLQQRGRIPPEVTFAEVKAALELQVLELPASLWTVAASLPNYHGDPVDRMLVAHAMLEDMTLVTADTTIHTYPIRTLW
jgi:PIN domain nuclease of toxin-antitoxin system